MNTNFKFFAAMLLVAMTNNAVIGQQKSATFADAAFAYKGFSRGGSTNNILNNSRTVDTVPNASKHELDQNNLDTLNFLMCRVKSKRHFQQKVGPTSFYASIFKDGKERRIAVLPGWAILDLENRRQYVFKKSPWVDIYRRFVDRNFR